MGIQKSKTDPFIITCFNIIYSTVSLNYFSSIFISRILGLFYNAFKKLYI